jgi:hypothetical protein
METAVTYFEIFFQHSSESLRKNLSQDSRLGDRELNPKPFDKEEVLTTLVRGLHFDITFLQVHIKTFSYSWGDTV